MILPKKIIFTGFAPNITKKDLGTSLVYLLLPWRWNRLRSGSFPREAEKSMREYMHTSHAYVFDSGRTALHAALKALGVGQGDAVLVQAYTCVVVINAIKQTGALPVYVDIGDDFNMNVRDAEQKMSGHANVKALIIQHTFGAPADTTALIALAEQHGITTIEDCAHALGAEYANGVRVGTYADIGMFSFGSDKVISCVRGGALTCGDPELAKKIAEEQASLPLPPTYSIVQHLLQIPVFTIGKALYRFGIGKPFLATAKKLHIVNHIVYAPEKRGGTTPGYPAQLANALANILVHQLRDIDARNAHRTRIARIYAENIKNKFITIPAYNPHSIYVRFPILVNNPHTLRAYMKKHGVLIGDWYQQIVAPKDTDASCTDYVPHSCPHAETLARQSLNLPTNRFITEHDANRIVDLLNAYGN